MQQIGQYYNRGLEIFTKCLCAAVLILIFVGALVTSHGAGLSVPDWPTTYGQNMFLFPYSQWVGGIFYEHGHRLLASAVGLLTVILTFWMWRCETRFWVKRLTYCALLAVVLQGILGGVTVLLQLPAVVSVSHAVLAQTFFILTIIIAYSHSLEFHTAAKKPWSQIRTQTTFKLAVISALLIYLQLIIGAVMRHTESGLAIPDFPKMGNSLLPIFDSKMLHWINQQREHLHLPAVTVAQVLIHFLHRIFGIVVAGFVTYASFRICELAQRTKIARTAKTLLLLVLIQFLLGIYTVLSHKSPVPTSLHVVTGAILLGTAVILTLRAAIIRLK